VCGSGENQERDDVKESPGHRKWDTCEVVMAGLVPQVSGTVCA
jgi:hypothetical protein